MFGNWIALSQQEMAPSGAIFLCGIFRRLQADETQSASRDVANRVQQLRDSDGFLDHRVANSRQEGRHAR